MTYWSGKKGHLEVSEMNWGHLNNARKKLAARLATGETEGPNTAETLAELDAELVRRSAEFAAQEGPTTTTGETIQPQDEDEEIPW